MLFSACSPLCSWKSIWDCKTVLFQTYKINSVLPKGSYLLWKVNEYSRLATWQVEWSKHLKERERSKLGMGTTELQATSGSGTLNRAQSELLNCGIQIPRTVPTPSQGKPAFISPLQMEHDSHCQGPIDTKEDASDLRYLVKTHTRLLPLKRRSRQSLKSSVHIARSFSLPMLSK